MYRVAELPGYELLVVLPRRGAAQLTLAESVPGSGAEPEP
jgi:hypothetical protein